MHIDPLMGELSADTMAAWRTIINTDSGGVFLISSIDAHLLHMTVIASVAFLTKVQERDTSEIRQADPEVCGGPDIELQKSVDWLKTLPPGILVLAEVADRDGLRAACSLARVGWIVIAGVLSRNSVATIRRVAMMQLDEEDIKVIRGALAVRSLPRASSPTSVVVSEVRSFKDGIRKALSEIDHATDTSGDMNLVSEAMDLVDRALVSTKAVETRFITSDIEAERDQRVSA